MLYSVLILSIATPFLTIGAFILGWNLNAPMGKKIGKKEARVATEDEKLLDYIDSYLP